MSYSEGKRLFENVSNTKVNREDGKPGGWIVGVMVVDDETGKGEAIPLPVGEKVWLSEREMRLTAAAPKSPDDNPFVNGDLRESVEERAVPGVNDRYVPTPGAVPPEAPQEPEAPAEEPSGLTGDQVSKDLPQGAVPAAAAEAKATNPTEEDKRRLEAEEKAAKADDELRAAMAEKAKPAAEETAAAATADTSETGAAVKPDGQAPEGEYAKDEEVGTPDAPSKAKGQGQKTKDQKE